MKTELSDIYSPLSERQENRITASQLDTDYQTFYHQYKDINDFILPSRGRFFITDNNRGDRRNLNIYDPTATFAARTLSSGMMAGITSPARRWFELKSPNPDFADNENVKEWCEVVANRMGAIFNKSNLYNVLPSAYYDLGGFGTAFIFMEEDDEEVVRFYSFEIGSFRIAKDSRGRVNVFYREFQMTVRQMVEKFGLSDHDENGQRKINWSIFSQQVKDAWQNAQYETKIDVCHMIKPNQNYNPKKPLDPEARKFSSQYWELGTSDRSSSGSSGVDDDRWLSRKGYDYFPGLPPRWSVTGQDVYATDCPGMTAIGDIKQLQQGEKRGLQAIDKKVHPPMRASPGMRGSKMSMLPSDVTFLSEDGDKFEPAQEVNLSLVELENKQQQVRGRINTAFFVDLFLMMANSDRRQITAEEIKERQQEKLLAIGPVLEQLNQDVLNPLIENTFMIMAKQGLLPPAPEELQGESLQIDYISVMAQAQKLIGISSIERFMGFFQGAIALDPSARNKVVVNEMVDAYADALGVSAKIIRSNEEADAITAAQQKAQAAQAQMEAINVASQSAKNLSQSNLGEDNALSRILEQGNPLANA